MFAIAFLDLPSLAARFGLAVPVVSTTPQAAAEIFPKALPLVALPGEVRGALGQPDPADASATIKSIEIAVEYVQGGRADAVVTNPISKEILQRAGFAHPGHTEFLSELAHRLYGVTAHPVMLLWSPWLAVPRTAM